MSVGAVLSVDALAESIVAIFVDARRRTGVGPSLSSVCVLPTGLRER